MEKYTPQFYKFNNERKAVAAQTVLKVVLNRYSPVKSMVDVGCGAGVWLHTAKSLGVADIIGIDGDWLDPSLLLFSKDRFVVRDLNRPLELSRRFDLAVSLEVAEHLSPESAESFVVELTKLSDHVMFSAAIPGQGGVHHYNEQWPSYWIALFAAQGFTVNDFIRPAIWENERIPPYYRQNILFFSKNEKEAFGAGTTLYDVVHPKIFERAGCPGVKKSFAMLMRSLWRRLGRSLRGNDCLR